MFVAEEEKSSPLMNAEKPGFAGGGGSQPLHRQFLAKGPKVSETLADKLLQCLDIIPGVPDNAGGGLTASFQEEAWQINGPLTTTLNPPRQGQQGLKKNLPATLGREQFLPVHQTLSRTG